ncbi:2978_t:CDS:1, partial [Scutellospora calospora]
PFVQEWLNFPYENLFHPDQKYTNMSLHYLNFVLYFDYHVQIYLLAEIIPLS